MMILTRGPVTFSRVDNSSVQSFDLFITDVFNSLANNGIQFVLRMPAELSHRAIRIRIFIISFFEKGAPKGLRIDKINFAAAAGHKYDLLRQCQNRSFVCGITDVVGFTRLSESHRAHDSVHNVTDVGKRAHAFAFAVDRQRLSCESLFDETGQHKPSLRSLAWASHVEGAHNCGM